MVACKDLLTLAMNLNCRWSKFAPIVPGKEFPLQDLQRGNIRCNVHPPKTNPKLIKQRSTRIPCNPPHQILTAREPAWSETGPSKRGRVDFAWEEAGYKSMRTIPARNRRPIRGDGADREDHDLSGTLFPRGTSWKRGF